MRFSIHLKHLKEFYSRVSRLSGTRYPASVNANPKFHNFSGISLDIEMWCGLWALEWVWQHGYLFLESVC